MGGAGQEGEKEQRLSKVENWKTEKEKEKYSNLSDFDRVVQTVSACT